jgi:hypothetical protein
MTEQDTQRKKDDRPPESEDELRRLVSELWERHNEFVMRIRKAQQGGGLS